MWRNYSITAWRTLLANKSYTLINIAGLAIGIASCILILLFVRHETSYDKWIPDHERVFALQTITEGSDGERIRSSRAPRVAAGALAQAFPQIEEAAALTRARVIAQRDGESSFAETYFVDSNFLDVLQLPLLKGDPRTALSEAGNLVLTESDAIRLFGTDDPLGETLTYIHRGEARELRVTGVLRDLPQNSHLEFELLTPFAHHMYGSSEREFGSWGHLGNFVYAKLRPGADAAAINAAMPAFIERTIPDPDGSDPAALEFVPIADIHLHHTYEESMKPGGDRAAVTAFSAIALFILTIACMNFANLATAQSTQRAREVALRKVMGANRGQLIVQFLSEAMLLTIGAVLVALAAVEVILPYFSNFVGVALEIDYIGVDGLLPFVLLLALVVGLICGFYPAFVLSRFSPAKVLRSHVAPGAPGSVGLRNLLVIAQFAISIGLIICTAVVYAQTSHARSVDPGYQRDGLLLIDNLGRGEVESGFQPFIEGLKRIPEVRSMARSDLIPADEREEKGEFQARAGEPPVVLFQNSVDWDFFETLGITTLAGRTLSEQQGVDDASVGYNPYSDAAEALIERGTNVVVNASAARRLGFASPADAVGKRIATPFVERDDGAVRATIVGVVSDARFRSVRDEVRPTVYRFNEYMFSHLLVRYESASPNRLRQQVEALWNVHFSEVPFEAEFADDRLASLYDTDTVRGTVFAAFAALAVIVACLGLFGLAAFSTRRRTKEIGIRKVFGARTGDIVRLLVWQFCQPVIVANLIAWPIAWWLMRDWLNNFSDRIDLHPGLFLAAGLIALLIATLTVSGHAVRAARARPIHALRYE